MYYLTKILPSDEGYSCVETSHVSERQGRSGPTQKAAGKEANGGEFRSAHE